MDRTSTGVAVLGNLILGLGDRLRHRHTRRGRPPASLGLQAQSTMALPLRTRPRLVLSAHPRSHRRPGRLSSRPGDHRNRPGTQTSVLAPDRLRDRRRSGLLPRHRLAQGPVRPTGDHPARPAVLPRRSDRNRRPWNQLPVRARGRSSTHLRRGRLPHRHLQRRLHQNRAAAVVGRRRRQRKLRGRVLHPRLALGHRPHRRSADRRGLPATAHHRRQANTRSQYLQSFTARCRRGRRTSSPCFRRGRTTARSAAVRERRSTVPPRSFP